MPARIFTRQQLLDLIWSAPMRKLAADVGVSDVWLRKAAIGAGIPIPPVGHWNRVLAGKKTVSKPKLPPRGFGASDKVAIGKGSWANGGSRAALEEPPPEPTFDETIDEVRSRAARSVGKVRVPSDLSAPHPVVRKLLEHDEAQAEKARSSPYLASFYPTRFAAPVDRRRLRLMNAIARGAAKAGLATSLSDLDQATLRVGSGLAGVSVSVRKPDAGRKKSDRPDRITIAIEGVDTAKWTDSDEKRLETVLTDIVVEVVVQVEQRYRDNESRHHKWLADHHAARIEAARQAEIEAARRERERIAKLEQERIDRLLDEADRLRKADTIRAYVATVGERTIGAGIADDEFARWRDWALAQANRIDPLTGDAFLRGFDRAE